MAAGALLFGAVLLAGCSDDEKGYDFPGIDHERIYIADANQDIVSTLVQTPVGYVKALNATIDIKVTKAAAADQTITYAVDNSLVAEYNAEHGTEYQTIDVAAFSFSTPEVVIPAGATAAVEPLVITFSETAENYITSTSTKYLLPIVVKSSTNAEYQKSTNMGVRYVVVGLVEKALRDKGTQADVLGTEATDYTTWTSEPSGFSGLFSGSSWNRRYNVGSNPGEFVLDFQQVRNLTGVAILAQYANYYIWYPQWYGEYCPKSFGLEVSTDGANFTDIGTLTGEDEFTLDDSGYAWLVLYGPIPCRYLKVKQELGYGSNITGFRAYFQ